MAGRIAVGKATAIAGECSAIAGGHAAFDRTQITVRADAIERCILDILGAVEAAQPEAPRRIGAPVIHAVARFAGEWLRPERDGYAVPGIGEGATVLHAEDEAALFTEGEASNWRVEAAALDGPARRIPAQHFAPVDFDPVEAVLPRVPARSLAKRAAGIEEQGRFGREPVKSCHDRRL